MSIGANKVMISSLCKRLKISRQAFYKGSRKRKRQKIEEIKIVNYVSKERQKHSKMGGRKLLVKLRNRFILGDIDIGRDRFFDVLRHHGLLIKRRRKYCKTTNSLHEFYKYKNLIKDMEIKRPNEVWVSDITYIKTYEGFLYLSLITDAYSRKIVGYEVNDTLESIGCEKALDKALKQLPRGEHPIHHSDRGIQYCCNEYVKKLRKHKLSISMTEENHCYENAQAERVNGILKGEYYLGDKFLSKEIAKRACRQAIYLYNTDRPHMSLNMQVPEMVHMGLETMSLVGVN